MSVTVLHGKCEEVLPTLPDCSVDSVVTDPPYELGFMGKGWDSTGIAYSVPMWAEVLRVLKPGGHLLSFGGTRTWHRMAVAIEDAGFEMRDSIAWLYGSGFPKSLDVSKAIDKARRRDYVHAAVRLGMTVPGRNLDDWTKEDHAPGDKWWTEFRAHLPAEDWQAIEREDVAHGTSGAASIAYARDSATEYAITAPATPDAARWEGWGTALKPAFEPIVVARKPLAGTVAQNVLAWGTGALNIDGCRVDGEFTSGWSKSGSKASENDSMSGPNYARDPKPDNPAGRWPANVILDEFAADILDAQSGWQRDGTVVSERRFAGWEKSGDLTPSGSTYGGEGGASRFFYVAKAPKSERPKVNGVAHATVKPLTLIRYLVRLVTPPGGTVLDPFAGSGTTGEAAILEGFNAILIEREADHLPLIHHRLTRANDALGLFGEETA